MNHELSETLNYEQISMCCCIYFVLNVYYSHNSDAFHPLYIQCTELIVYIMYSLSISNYKNYICNPIIIAFNEHIYD